MLVVLPKILAGIQEWDKWPADQQQQMIGLVVMMAFAAFDGSTTSEGKVSEFFKMVNQKIPSGVTLTDSPWLIYDGSVGVFTLKNSTLAIGKACSYVKTIASKLSDAQKTTEVVYKALTKFCGKTWRLPPLTASGSS
jgi:hypothetical protein